MFNCWPTATADAARAVGRPEITADALTNAARGTEIEVQSLNKATGTIETHRSPAFADHGGGGGQGMWGKGQAPVLRSFGAEATRVPVNTPGQFRGLGAYANSRGRSVTLDMENAGGGGHTIRLLSVSRDGKVATVADPGPGIAKDVPVIDLFQQAYSATMIQW
jgi:hypothetical protein